MRFPKNGYYRLMVTMTNKPGVIQTLERQHKVINNSLSALEGWTASFAQQSGVDLDCSTSDDILLDDLQSFMHFFQTYIKDIHNATEEDILFAGIRDYGFSLIQNHAGIFFKG